MNFLSVLVLTAVMSMNVQYVFAADQLSNQKKDAVEWIDMNRAQFQAAADYIFEHPETALRKYRSGISRRHA